jgi:hypothetical protein
MPGAKLLRLGGKAQERVDLAVHEELHWPDGAAGYPINIFAGVDTDIGGDDGQKEMRGRAKGLDPDTLALQLENAVNPFVPNTSKQPRCTGPRAVIGMPRSSAAMSTGAKFEPKSISPREIPSGVLMPVGT